MAGKRRNAESGNGAWQSAYANVITLLLTFFVLLFAMSTPDTASFNALVSAFGADRPAEGEIMFYASGTGTETDPGTLEDFYRQTRDYIHSNNLQDSVALSYGEGFVFIRFMEEILFQPNSARLKNTDMEILNFIGTGIKSIENRVGMISVIGHTAAIPDNPDYEISDRQLAGDRANTVLVYLEENGGVDPEKLLAVSWGKWKPLPDAAGNRTQEQQAKNRRVELLISAESPISVQLDGAYEDILEQ